MRSELNTAHALGARGEAIAAHHLVRLGWTVVDRNWRCPEGELDIVARDGRWYVACEVKTRRNGKFGHPLEAVTPAKAARLRRLALRWGADHGIPPTHLRVDALGLLLAPAGFTIEHLRAIS
ncbi:YraN family protein [Actinomadura atramentaria]|uniref:YraN family protein n=1 Tax=Actinomadura atramentaria TaxID=1990 RepID=UPI0003821CBE|nr:YraN family protein [Actinomadura atramentaria]